VQVGGEPAPAKPQAISTSSVAPAARPACRHRNNSKNVIVARDSGMVEPFRVKRTSPVFELGAQDYSIISRLKRQARPIVIPVYQLPGFERRPKPPTGVRKLDGRK